MVAMVGGIWGGWVEIWLGWVEVRVVGVEIVMSITKHSMIHCMFQLGLLLKQDPRRSKKHLMG